MTVLIVGSPEFVRRSGGTPGFVNAAYRAILGRPADAGGRDHWNRRLAAGTTPGQVANALQFSHDGLNRVITSRVRAALHHDPTNAERSYWFLGLSVGITIERQTALLYGRGAYLSQFSDPYCCLGGGGYRVAPGGAAARARGALHRDS